MEEKAAALAKLLRQAGEAHHQAFIATDGAHDDWAIWYADYLFDKLPQHLGKQLIRSEIVYALVRLDHEIKAEKPSEHWADYDARLLLERYG